MLQIGQKFEPHCDLIYRNDIYDISGYIKMVQCVVKVIHVIKRFSQSSINPFGHFLLLLTITLQVDGYSIDFINSLRLLCIETSKIGE